MMPIPALSSIGLFLDYFYTIQILRMTILKKIRIWLFVVLILGSFSAHSQEMWGSVIGNYAGSQSMFLNPANMTTSKLYMDIHLASGGIYAQNNYIYIPKESHNIFSLIDEGLYFLDYYNEHNDLPPYSEWTFNEQRYSTPRDVYAFFDIELRGPSGFYAINEHAFGVYTRWRNVGSSLNIPYDLANFAKEGIGFDEQLDVNYSRKNFGYAAASWLEFGLSYAYVFHKYNRDHWSAGISVKRLYGYMGSFLDVDELAYRIQDDRTLVIENTQAQAGVSLPLDYDSNAFPDEGDAFKGSGFGVDIGVTYQKKKKGHSARRYTKACEQPYEDYVYQLGVSILDIGRINYTKNTQVHTYENGVVWDNFNRVGYSSINQITRLISERFYGDTLASLTDDKFHIGLPTSFNTQFDWHIKKRWYLASNLLIPLKFSDQQLRKPAQFIVAPRYEGRNIGFQMPFMLHEWEKVRMGFSARFYFLTVGTDKLSTFLGLGDIDGMDFYVSVKFNFLKGKCGRRIAKDCNF